MLDKEVLAKLDEVEARFERLTTDLGNAEVIADQRRFQAAAKERSSLEPLVEALRTHRATLKDVEEHEALANDPDPELREMARGELGPLRQRAQAEEELLKIQLIPKDPNDDRNVIVEIRAGTGGEEAALFAAELFRMYVRYGERHGWKVDLISRSDSGMGGLREVIASLEGQGAWSQLKY